MKRHRYKVSFLLTSLLYASAIGLYLYTHKNIIPIADKPHESKIILAMSQFVPQPPAEVLSPPQPKEPEREEEEIVKPQEPEPEPPKPKVTPVVKKEPKPKPKPVSKPVVKKSPKKAAKKPKKVVKKHKKRHLSGGNPHRSAARKNAFLANIRAKINRAKSYPRIAKRRGMQGSVKARFTILKNGDVSNITLSGASLFYTSVRKAIKRAFPVNPHQAPMTLPTTVTVTLRYRLQH